MDRFIRVAIPPLSGSFSYILPANIASSIRVGMRVQVPLGNRQVLAYVLESSEEAPQDLPADLTLKEVCEQSEALQVFLPSQIKFFDWIARYYGAPLSNVIENAIPTPVSPRFQRQVVLRTSAPREKLGKTQRAILEELIASGSVADYNSLLRKFSGASSTLKRLEQRKLIEIISEELLDSHHENEAAPDWAKSSVVLNAEQQEAFEQMKLRLAEAQYSCSLLHGVTGSGKTEVYIELIREVLASGQSALVIVPEIALTPQLIDRFRARLGQEIAVLHSAVGKRARWDAWRSLLEGRGGLALGARSGIFAPLEDLGLIIVDEEHEQSFKQSDGLRYNARDLALVRAQQANCPVLLGSATPSIETYYNAAKRRYHYLSLPSRPESSSSISIEIVDLNLLRPWEMASAHVSKQVHQALEEVLERNEQAFLLYNRRGFASYLQCGKCEEVVSCPNCSVTLTLHRGKNSLVCHYCGLELLVPKFCPHCSANKPSDQNDSDSKSVATLEQRGAGTERVYEEICELFPQAKVERLDRDRASNAKLYKELLQNVRSGEIQILVGTQMIAKGHDLPGVTLVGIIDCDVGLHLPDFRASERSYQLLTQAAGRAGRGERSGKVLLQTRVPKHPAIEATLQSDFKGFAKQEIVTRKTLDYPPFSRMLRVVAASQEKGLAERLLNEFASRALAFIQAQDLKVELLGPAIAPIERIRTLWRAHLMLKAERSRDLHLALRYLQNLKVRSSKIRITYDIDPQDML